MFIGERSLTNAELLTSIPRGPFAQAELLRVVRRLNRMARQIELEGVPTYTDRPLFRDGEYRVVLLFTLRQRMAMRSARWQMN